MRYQNLHEIETPCLELLYLCASILRSLFLIILPIILHKIEALWQALSSPFHLGAVVIGSIFYLQLFVSTGDEPLVDTRWNLFGFSDENDRVIFGRFWVLIKKIKYNNPSCSSLVLTCDDVKFPIEGWRRLGLYLFGAVPWKENTTITRVVFSMCSFTAEGVNHMLPFLKAASGITILSVRSNIGSKGMRLLAKDVLNGSQIELLNLTGCKIDDFSALGSCILPALRELRLKYNDVGDEGAKIIADNFVRAPSKLQRLYIGSSKIGAEGVKSISEALATNHTLTVVDIANDFNDIKLLLNMNCIFAGSMKKDELANLATLTRAKRRLLKGNGKERLGLECPICWELKEEFYVILPCGHKICYCCKVKFVGLRCYSRCGSIEKFLKLY